MTGELLVRVTYVDGTPVGMRRASFSRTNTRAIAFPIESWINVRASEELSKPGVYFLVGRIKHQPVLYVGQTRHLDRRLTNHPVCKQWPLTEFIAVTSSDDWLMSAHTENLEHRCWERVKSSEWHVVNTAKPSQSPLRQEERHELDAFFDEMVFLTRALGFEFLLPRTPSVSASAAADLPRPKRLAAPAEPSPSPSPGTVTAVRRADDTGVPSNLVITCVLCGSHSAVLHCSPGRFRLQQGTKVNPPSLRSLQHEPTIVRRWQAALGANEVQEFGDGWYTVMDLEFHSPSGAAAFVAGRPMNGWQEWKNDQGQRLKDFETLLGR